MNTTKADLLRYWLKTHSDFLNLSAIAQVTRIPMGTFIEWVLSDRTLPACFDIGPVEEFALRLGYLPEGGAKITLNAESTCREDMTSGTGLQVVHESLARHLGNELIKRGLLKFTDPLSKQRFPGDYYSRDYLVTTSLTILTT